VEQLRRTVRVGQRRCRCGLREGRQHQHRYRRRQGGQRPRWQHLHAQRPEQRPGYYSFFTPTPPFNGPAMRTFTASDPHYASVSIQEAITPNTVNRLDFTLQAGWLSIAPTSLFDFLNPGQTDDQTPVPDQPRRPRCQLPADGHPAAALRCGAAEGCCRPDRRSSTGQAQAPAEPQGHSAQRSASESRTPLAAGDVITTWPNVSTNNWGVGYAQLTDRVWVGSVSYFGGDGKDHEYKTDGTPTGNNRRHDLDDCPVPGRHGRSTRSTTRCGR